MALFIEICEYPKKAGVIRHVFLNSQYSKEDLEEKLDALIIAEKYSEEYIDRILLTGKQLKRKYTLKLKHEAVLSTEASGFSCRYHAKNKVIIHPDGTWTEVPYLNFVAKIKKIVDAWREDWAKPR